MVAYREKEFIPYWKELLRHFVIYSINNHGTTSWSAPPDLLPGETHLVLITHDESTFSANDGKRKVWMKQGQQPLRQKGQEKGIMVSGFLSPRGQLQVPNAATDSILLDEELHPHWPRQEDGTPIRNAMKFLGYVKGNCWTGEKMIASSMNLNPDGEQVHMRETFVSSLGRTQLLTWPEDDSVPIQLRVVPKGLKQVLMERGLCPANNTRSDGFAFLTQCPTTGGRLGCNRSEPIPGCCCTRYVMANESDFRN